MSKIRFSGFPTGSTVTISALKGGAARGPVTVSAWKQAPASGDAAFKVYSIYGTGQESTLMDPEGTISAKEILPGSVIEMPNHGALHLFYDDFSSFSTDDPRRLAFETDFGERYDAQHFDHPFMPSGFTTPAANGATLGLNRGCVCGHAFRGTDMSGVQVLDKDHQEGSLPAGITDRTVTCWVSDGLTSSEMSFTVRLIDPLRYYTDRSKTTYGTNAYTFGATENRKGVFVISTDPNETFAGAPVGEGPGEIYYLIIPDGKFLPGFPKGNSLTDGVTAYDSYTYVGAGSPVFTGEVAPWSADLTIATLWKRGQTFYPMQGNSADMSFVGSVNALMGVWGAGTDFPKFAVAPDRHKSLLWTTDGDPPLFFARDNGQRAYGLEFVSSDYDPSDTEWLEWWNILPYANKTGTIAVHTDGDAQTYDGDVLSDAGGTGYTAVIADTDNGDGTGTLLVRQIVDGPDGKSGLVTTFADGTVLSGPTGSITLAFDGTERLDRTRQPPPTAIKGDRQTTSAGSYGICIDGCVVRGARTGIDAIGNGWVISDTLVLHCHNYGMFSNRAGFAMSGVIILQRSDHNGDYQNVPPLVDDRGKLNVCDPPGNPLLNHVGHAGLRQTSSGAMSMHKCGGYWYGGNAGAHQPFLRIGTSGAEEGQVYFSMTDCFWKNGRNTLNFSARGGGTDWESLLPEEPTEEPNRVPFTPKAIVIDGNLFEAGPQTRSGTLVAFQFTNVGVKTSTFSYPAGLTFEMSAQSIDFLAFNDGGPFNANPDVNAVACFVEDCTYVYRANNTQTAIDDFDRDIRGTAVTHARSMTDIDLTKFPDGVSPDYG